MRFFSTLVASTLGALLALGLVFFVGLLLVIGLAASSGGTAPVPDGAVLVIDLAGPIPEQVADDPFARAFEGEAAFDLYDLKLALQKAAADDRIAGVWLQMHGVMASWATLQEIRAALLHYKESGKPIYASSGEYVMAEDDYFLASVADSVFASPEGFFEFNGFFLDVLFFKDMLDKLDVEPQVVRAGKFKSAVEPFFREDLSEENKEQLTALLQSQNRVFLDAIAESRSRTAAEVERQIQDQAFLTTDDAYAAGWLDGLLFDSEVESVFKERLGLDAEDDLATVGIRAYTRVPAAEAGIEVGREGEIAVVYAVGTIMPGTSSGSDVVGSETFGEAMQAAREDDDVRAVVLRINSPGGSASASDAMWHEIQRTAEVKPLIVSMGDVAASGGYWIATAADTIVADDLTITGSIGVFSLFFDVGDMLENKIGITADGVSTSAYADMFSGLRPLSEPERALLQRSTDATYQRFLEKVAASRGLDVAQVDSIGQGRIWTGEQALEIGLVDVLGDLDTALAIAAEKAGLEEGSYRTRLLPKPRTFLDELNEAFSARVAQAWFQAGTSPTERLLLQHVRTLDQLLSMQGTVQARLPLEITIR